MTPVLLSFGAIFTCQVVKMPFRPYPAKDAIVIETLLIKVKQVKSKHIHTRLTCGKFLKKKAAACLLCDVSSHSKLTIRFQHEYKQARDKAGAMF